MTTGESASLPRSHSQGFFDPPSLLRRSRFLRVVLVLAVLAGGAGIAYFGAINYPGSRPPSSTELEKKVATVFGDPTIKQPDEHVLGDFLVERFYILNALSGERYIADYLKGTIRGIQNVSADPLNPSYVYLLDMGGLKKDESLLNAYVQAISRPEELGEGTYIGLIAATGNTNAFPMNYTGRLPLRRAEFRGPDDEDLQSFLLSLKYETISDAPQLIDVDGYSYLLSNSDAFPLFKNEMGLNRALFVSELLIVDATSRADREQYFRLFNSLPRK